jgi:GNAT superfamily N-acetyltransferase
MNNLLTSLLEQKDILDAARTLSLAMVSNPLHVAVFQGQGEEERQEIERMFKTLLRDFPGVVFLAKIKTQIVGVLRMKSCQRGQATNEIVDEEVLKDQGLRVSHWQNIWTRHDPKEPHWHLGPVGVLPSHQGSGIGTVLMQRFCREIDACKAAAYLETDLKMLTSTESLVSRITMKLISSGLGTFLCGDRQDSHRSSFEKNTPIPDLNRLAGENQVVVYALLTGPNRQPLSYRPL